MEFTDVLRKRRMVRGYLDTPVPPEVLNRIVRVIRRAPSAGNAQPHRVAVITDAVARRALADIAEPAYLDKGFAPWLTQAPCHLVLGVRETDYHLRYQEPDKLTTNGAEIPWPVPFWWFDSGALFALLQLAAINEGLATGFYSPAPPDKLAGIAAIAQFPSDVAVTGVVTVGYRGVEPSRPRRPRKPLGESVTWI